MKLRVPLTIAICIAAGASHAQTLDSEALQEIADFAESFCGDYARTGSGEELNLEGKARAEIDGLLKHLASIGVEGAAKFDSGEYVGVLREELGGELKSIRECRLMIWNDLKTGVTDASSQSSRGPVSVPDAVPSASAYLYPFTATTLLRPIDLASFDTADLRLMRNEIYARHGYAFQSADLRQLFGAQSWYRPVTGDAEAVWRAMSDLERANVEAIKAAEQAR